GPRAVLQQPGLPVQRDVGGDGQRHLPCPGDLVRVGVPVCGLLVEVLGAHAASLPRPAGAPGTGPTVSVRGAMLVPDATPRRRRAPRPPGAAARAAPGPPAARRPGSRAGDDGAARDRAGDAIPLR